MGKLNWNQSGYTPSEETISQPTGTWFVLAHDYYSDLEIWTGTGKTGTQLTEGVDYERGHDDAVASATYTTGTGESATVYTQLRLLNYGSTTLYVYARYHGDNINTSDIVQTEGENVFTAAQTFEDQTVLKEQSSQPAAPSAGYIGLYADSDGLKTQNPSGTEAAVLTGLSQKWATNFSLPWRESTEDYGMLKSYEKNKFNYGFRNGGFDSIEKGHVRSVCWQYAHVLSEEFDFDANWSYSGNSGAIMGQQAATSTAGAVGTFKFFGNAISIAYVKQTASGIFKLEWSDDDGTTWYGEKIVDTDYTTLSGDVVDVGALDYTWDTYAYRTVRITQVNTDSTKITSARYRTIATQYEISRYWSQSSATIDTDDIPFGAVLLTGTGLTVNASNNTMWNYSYQNITTSGDKINFKFYGKILWICLYAGNSDVSITIDGATTDVINDNFDLTTTGTNTGVWVRVSDDTLSDGEHECEITAGTGNVHLQGYRVYSEKYDSTVTQEIILGGDTEIVPVDDSDWDFTNASGSTGLETNDAYYLRRRFKLDNTSDYVEIDTPTGVNAVYLIAAQASGSGTVEITLDGLKSRKLNANTNSTDNNMGLKTLLLYDSKFDGDLDSQTLRITSLDGNKYQISAVIFEKWGDGPFEANQLYGMRKWHRFETGANIQQTVSSTLRIDLEGAKADISPGALPDYNLTYKYVTIAAGVDWLYFESAHHITEATFSMVGAQDSVPFRRALAYQDGDLDDQLSQFQHDRIGVIATYIHESGTLQYDWCTLRVTSGKVV